jgi:hypothetical protein
MDPAGAVYLRGRLSGHGLRCRGEAYLAVDCYEDRCSTNVGHTVHQENGPSFNSVRGTGHAVCQCGALSPHLHYGSERRWWHRRHKARALLGLPEPAGQPTPSAPETVA